MTDDELEKLVTQMGTLREHTDNNLQIAALLMITHELRDINLKMGTMIQRQAQHNFDMRRRR